MNYKGEELHEIRINEVRYFRLIDIENSIGYQDIRRSFCQDEKFILTKQYVNRNKISLPYKLNNRGNIYITYDNLSRVIKNTRKLTESDKITFLESMGNYNTSKIVTACKEKIFFDKLEKALLMKREVVLKYWNYMWVRTDENYIKNDINRHLFNENILQHQFPFGKYNVDCYIPELDLIVEYDEIAHKYNKGDDITREKDIEKHFNKHMADSYDHKLNWIRVKEGEDDEELLIYHICELIAYDRLLY